MLGRFRSAIYSAIGTIEVEPGTPVPGVAGSGDNVRIGKVSLKLLYDIDYYPWRICFVKESSKKTHHEILSFIF